MTDDPIIQVAAEALLDAAMGGEKTMRGWNVDYAEAAVAAATPLIERRLRDRILADLRRNWPRPAVHSYSSGYRDGYIDATTHVEKSPT
jgi:hypothetical protein